MKTCTICHSWAINEHLHNRVRGHNSHLCDTCYWEEEAKQYKASHARLVKALEELQKEIYDRHYGRMPDPVRQAMESAHEVLAEAEALTN